MKSIPTNLIVSPISIPRAYFFCWALTLIGIVCITPTRIAIAQIPRPSNESNLNNPKGTAKSTSSETRLQTIQSGPADIPQPKDEEEPLEKDDLIQIQQKIKQVLPKVLPCVVAIDGGSGVVVNSKGLILTASHVANRAGRTVQVKFPDGRVVQATTLGTNNATDASALQINSPGPWPHLRLAQNPKLQAGDWCLAFGYPSSYPRNTQASLRVGRILKMENGELTTDCLLMGGDSGGPLVNLNGEIIGINSRVKNRIDENFHIPSSVFIDQWSKIVTAYDIRERTSPTGQRAYLGLNAETDSERIRIRKVHTNSPAETAGLQPEDVILQFDGRRVADFDEILRALDGRQPGEEVMLVVNRYGRVFKVYLVLGQQY